MGRKKEKIPKRCKMLTKNYNPPKSLKTALMSGGKKGKNSNKKKRVLEEKHGR